MEDYKKQFHIRYAILTFTIRMSCSCTLPPQKSSMFRGGFGNCLLDCHCISAVKPPDCAKCSFEKACIVRKIMYASLKCEIPSLCGVQSEGYIFDCTDKRTKFHQGDTLSFSVTLFGDIIVYLQPVLQSFFRLGQEGIGNGRAGFEIIEIKNSFGEKFFEQGNVYLKNYRFRYLEEYCEEREKELSKKTSGDVRIKLLSPLSLQYQGTMLQNFHAGAFLNGLGRRAYIMNCFEGNADAVQRKWKDGTVWGYFEKEAGEKTAGEKTAGEKAAGEKTAEEKAAGEKTARGKVVGEKKAREKVEEEKAIGEKAGQEEMTEMEYIPQIEVKKCFYKEISRYSSTQKKKMPLSGIEGEFILHEPDEEMLWYLLAGEILHVGKYSSFGFGKYIVKK